MGREPCYQTWPPDGREPCRGWVPAGWQFHGCTLGDRHKGDHVCECGDTRERTGFDTKSVKLW